MVQFHKIISVLMILLLFIIGIEIIVPNQERMITEYCINHPNEFIEGDMTINCSEWLENNPELVENCIKNNVGE